MNSKIAKRIRRFCKLYNRPYKRYKNAYLALPPEEKLKALYHMKKATEGSDYRTPKKP